MNEFLRRLTEGRAPWGTLDVSPASRGLWQRVRLTVYPPGITHGERRALHVAHIWPVAGGILCLFGLVALSGAGPVLSLAAVLAAYGAGFAVTARLTRDLRGRSRVLTVASEYVGGEVREFGDVHLLRTSVGRLTELENRRRSGDVTAVTYEAEWAAVYDALPAKTAPALQDH
ncbi:DUF6611 family protein [Leifsonia sp. AG29]|uniref:DUF6611 family protein n=1 Tax=Leifsonia sp. AG29 TaxID=2598860 RepID=UPI00131E7F2C|nr:DUF6611 family protein [Leifsonia sp. AG29]